MFSIETADVLVDDSATLVEESVAIPLPNGVLVVRLTVPENPLDPVIEIVDMPVVPELIVNDDGLVVMLKSGTGTVTDTAVEWELVELLAITLTM